MSGEASPKMSPLTDSGNWPGIGKRREKVFQLEAHRSRTQSGKFKEPQAAQAGASALGGGAER